MTEYASLRDKIRAEKAERLARYAAFDRALEDAHAAGLAAGDAARPVPMVVTQREHPLGDIIGLSDEENPVVYREVVDDGVCGFAWIVVRPATSSFARYVLKNKERWRTDSYRGGAVLSVRAFGQSLQRKEAYARAFAQVLSDRLGIRVGVDTRED